MKALFYVQHLLGIGHLHRTLRLAEAAAGAGIAAIVVSGGDAAGAPSAVPVVQLPPAQARDSRFSGLVDHAGRDIDEAFRERRRNMLLATFDDAAPDVLVTELFPFGRRQLRFELLPLLERAATRRPRCAIVCSVRDILVPPANAAKAADMAATARRFYDAVLVHGDAALVRFEETFPEAAALDGLIRYTGYVAPPRPAPAVRRSGVVVSAGGSAVGLHLLSAAIEARGRSSLRAAPWRILVPPAVSDSEFGALRARAAAGVTVERARPDFRALLAGAALSISQAGYNTVMDVVVSGPRAIFVPFHEERQSEQALRAARFAERCGYHHLAGPAVTPQALASTVDRAALGEPRHAAIDLDGARTTAQFLHDLLARA